MGKQSRIKRNRRLRNHTPSVIAFSSDAIPVRGEVLELSIVDEVFNRPAFISTPVGSINPFYRKHRKEEPDEIRQ